MVVAPGALPDLDQISVDDTEAVLHSAARNGHLVGAPLHLRDALS